jgi:hypothetical protein
MLCSFKGLASASASPTTHIPHLLAHTIPTLYHLCCENFSFSPLCMIIPLLLIAGGNLQVV